MTGYTSYLNDAESLSKAKSLIKFPGEISLDMLEEMMKVRAAYEILSATQEINSSKLPSETIWNEIVQVDLVQMVKSHSMLITFQCFRRVCENPKVSEPLRRQLLRCLWVFAGNDLVNNCIALHASGYFNHEQSHHLKEFYKWSLTDMRPHALNIIESYFHTDNVLNSAIGNYYGDIYEQ